VDSGRDILPSPHTPTPLAWSDQSVTLAWLGHATVLINFYGVKILTDPAFFPRVGISIGVGVAGPKRYVRPALDITALPPVDVVLLSHAHMDHLDLPSLRRLPTDACVVSAKDTTDLIKPTGLSNITELRWSEHTKLETKSGDLEIEAFEVKHWGERWPSEKPRGYNGYILRREGHSLLFGGDTAHTPLFRSLRSRGPFTAALMPIGAYRPWIRNHCTPEEALQMANDAGAKYIVPVHHQTFKLSDEPMEEPIERLQAALSIEPQRLALSDIGEAFVCPKT